MDRPTLRGHAVATMLGLALVLKFGVFTDLHAQAAERDVDLELVLAVDSSDSVDDREFALQIIGLADAFRHPEVIKALGGGPRKAIAVSVVEWADRGNQTVLIPWTVLDGASAARALAERIRTTPRTYERGVTSVSGIIDFAVASFARNGFRGSRLVIDISSDGRQNDGRPLADARAEALALGVTINALTILNEYGSLDDYYRREVIAGPSAFVEIAEDYSSYPKAILRKLIRELGSIPVVVVPRKLGSDLGRG
jgi:hypothetical protein